MSATMEELETMKKFGQSQTKVFRIGLKALQEGGSDISKIISQNKELKEVLEIKQEQIKNLSARLAKYESDIYDLKHGSAVEKKETVAGQE